MVDETIDDSKRHRPDVINADIPESFDAREQWPKCKTTASIKDQANCGSCWAVSSAAAMSDRLCIATDGKVSINLSPEYLMTCCSECGEGCNGGYPNKAWDWFQSNGLVTGGGYLSNEGCQPYQIGHSSPDVTPPCSRNACTNKKYPIPFLQDFHKGKIRKKMIQCRQSFVLSTSEKEIQTELMTNGPVVASFVVYADFMSYKSGVYQHVTGGYQGRHAVRVIGWGVENGVKYWLVANSWNTFWGDNGLFKIRRGNNECEFEQQMTAGLPAV
ncbi:hypothetical protein AAG570_001994 [Ranatra chinensis]|uniref:Peptidase C1A papain C-terminal domain-containing protein n=1 Tax=Ranatra chinensis TaxID=642074 RepID=A0ABD0YAY4_9HEMI